MKRVNIEATETDLAVLSQAMREIETRDLSDREQDAAARLKVRIAVLQRQVLDGAY